MTIQPEAYVQSDTPDAAIMHESTPYDGAKAELSAGLLGPSASISPKYLYDTMGSKLFEALCLLPEYYPTRTEEAVITANAASIASAVGPGRTLIDLGAGNCAKAARLFPLLAPRHYVPIDISKTFLEQAAAQLQRRYPQMRITPLAQDFSHELSLPVSVGAERRVFFYPGSSIGNFSPDEASAFLRRLRQACQADGAVLLGIDLIKNPTLLRAAYDDAIGLTSAFNLNLLRNVNRLLGSDFNVDDWVHEARFNSHEQCMQMYLKARHAVTVRWPGGQRLFAAHETIHTENSYKYTVPSFIQLLAGAGFANAQTWTDEQNWFAIVYAHAA